VDVFGHHHVSDDEEPISLPDFLERGEEHVARAHGAQQRKTPITTEGEEMEISAAVTSF
jgi:hypothetical protein